MTREEIEARTILRGVVGSTVHGLHVSDGLEDRDEMGVCIEPVSAAMGIHAPFEQLVYRSAAEREGRHDAPSQAGDLDLTIYSLRKYVRLALKGNPTILLLFFLPREHVMVIDARGAQLQEMADKIISRRAGQAFLGYLHAQRQRLLGERGNGGHGQPRRGLVEKFGFDTKFAGHMLRLGVQGVELMTTGRLTLPMPSPDRDWLLAVRNGGVPIQECLTRAGELEAELKDLLITAPIRPEPDEAAVEAWMLKLYQRAWSAERSIEDWREDAAIRESFASPQSVAAVDPVSRVTAG